MSQLPAARLAYTTLCPSGARLGKTSSPVRKVIFLTGPAEKGVAKVRVVRRSDSANREAAMANTLTPTAAQTFQDNRRDDPKDDRMDERKAPNSVPLDSRTNRCRSFLIASAV